ncbi:MULTISPECIES: asparagine synthase-related protein [Bacillus cereus group]|uniref:asparagine synthase-related protein n=1 Tax=Bacillus cereus group TaxID=86661 RepID=UPI000D114DAB|nr:asparagine synthase-related protein [Bacillus cereus]AVP47682.1 asparagine synthase [Bacillus cereus]MED3467484.1 asparagine synthase-related protein [Bacillus thuringiensis]
MNYFLAFVSVENIDLKRISIKNLIFNEFKQTAIEVKGEKEDFQFVYASNKNIKINEFVFENIVMIGDVSLHNKKELIQKYNLDMNMDNERLIIYLYKRKGIKILKDLIGEFSFILYDQGKKKVYAVRDQIGIKTLFWIRRKEGYIFASDIFLLKNFFDLSNLNIGYFKEFLEREGILDSIITPYRDVNRLSSGRYLISDTSNGDFEIRQYWDLSNIKDTIVYESQLDYFEEFTNLLSKSVKDRLVKETGNSIMLSGGMDSTSLYALSKNIEAKQNQFKISSVSAVFDELKECDERIYIEELFNMYKSEGQYINCDNKLVFEDFPNTKVFPYEPSVNATSFSLMYPLLRESVHNGASNILSGYGGDHLLTGSLHVTRDFLKKREIRKAFAYMTNYSICTNTSAFQNSINYMFFPNVAKEYVLTKNSNYYNYMSKKLKSIKYFHQKELYYQISNAKAHLYMDKVLGAFVGVDIKHPFLDRRLIEYIYKIPGEFRFSNMNTKYILRKSMENYLPESIVNRKNKTTHLAYIYKSIQKKWAVIFKVMQHPMIVERLKLVTQNFWEEELYKWRNGVENHESFWVLFMIEIWLIQHMQVIDRG